MATLDRGLLRKLADWSTDGLPVTSLYLDVDGRRHPKREDYLRVVDDLLRSLGADGGEREHHRSVSSDRERIQRFVREEFDRSGVRGLAVFSSAGAGLWEDVPLPQPVRDRVEVGARPRLLPLEAMLETFETFCTVVCGRERARILYTAMGRIEELADLTDEVPGRHDQGGWAQARYQRHIREHVQRHLKRVADVVLKLEKRRPFDHLVLAGTDDLVADLERELHDYVARKVLERATMPIGVSPGEVLAHCLEVEERLEAHREAGAVDRLAHEVAAGTGRAVGGVEATLAALEAGRVETLVLAGDLRASGARCPSCGHLDVRVGGCPACGSAMEPVDQLVDEAVESALRQRCRVETVGDGRPLAAVGGIGALLRF